MRACECACLRAYACVVRGIFMTLIFSLCRYVQCSRVGTNAKFGFYIVVLHIWQILECEERVAYIPNGVIQTLWFPNLLIRDWSVYSTVGSSWTQHYLWWKLVWGSQSTSSPSILHTDAIGQGRRSVQQPIPCLRRATSTWWLINMQLP